MDDAGTTPRAIGVELPPVSRARSAARLATTAAAFARHLGPLQARRMLRRPPPPEATAAAARAAVQTLGATYVKVGQFLAASPALVGEGTAAVFRSCLDRAASAPFADVRRAVEADLDAPLGSTFASFDETPIAAASMAVVHRATLHSGEHVAVKVLRPGIEATIASDLRVLRSTLRLLARQGVAPAAALLGFVNGLAVQFAEELDLRNEAAAMQRFADLFTEAGLDLLVVPHVHREASGRRVLTMSLLEGAAVDDLESVGELGLDPRPLVEQLLRSWYLGLVRDGSFHADIHAGNLIALPDGRLGVLDWGIVAHLDDDTHGLYRRIVEGCLGDESAWVDVAAIVLKLAPGMEGADPVELAPALRTQIEHTLLRPLGEGSLLAFPPMGGDPGHSMGGDPMWSSFNANSNERLTLRTWRARRAEVRRSLKDAGADDGFSHANLLTLKTIVYLEHYGRLYLPEVALLSDEAFLRTLLG